MKLLMVLMMLSVSMFAQAETGIKCYTTPSKKELAGTFYSGKAISFAYPGYRADPLEGPFDDGCLSGICDVGPGEECEVVQYCKTNRRRVNGLIPIEIVPGDPTYMYCRPKVSRLFN